MKFEHTQTWGFEHALRGMRNPLESWNKSDTKDCTHYFDTGFCTVDKCDSCAVGRYGAEIGANDMQLAKKLINAGSEHRKFLRQIFISVDITAPLYFWKEFDTYKIGTCANSTSTMHTLASTPITKECFECPSLVWDNVIQSLELTRVDYLKSKDKEVWKTLIVNLPQSWLQKRTITMNYENALNIYQQRKNHKLVEWSTDFVQWLESLPYFKELFIN